MRIEIKFHKVGIQHVTKFLDSRYLFCAKLCNNTPQIIGNIHQIPYRLVDNRNLNICLFSNGIYTVNQSFKQRI